MLARANLEMIAESRRDAVYRVQVKPFRGSGGGTWSKMYHYFQFRRDEFLQHYHKRSNVESTFSMMKRKFRDSLRSKTDVAMVNEVLCKVLCHNLVVLIHETHELGIDPVFWGKCCLKPGVSRVVSEHVAMDCDVGRLGRFWMDSTIH